MTEIVILGRVASKKNSKRIGVRHGRLSVRCSDAYKTFHDEAIKQIRKQGLLGKMIPSPYDVSYRFEIQGKFHVDVDNMMASVNDILQECGIIDDDDNIVSGQFVKTGGHNQFSAYISIRTTV